MKKNKLFTALNRLCKIFEISVKRLGSQNTQSMVLDAKANIRFNF